MEGAPQLEHARGIRVVLKSHNAPEYDALHASSFLPCIIISALQRQLGIQKEIIHACYCSVAGSGASPYLSDKENQQSIAVNKGLGTRSKKEQEWVFSVPVCLL